MSKIWLVNEPFKCFDEEGNDYLDAIVVEWTEADILNYYWDFWKGRMENRYGEGHELITKENCIEDWAVVNWAWEKKEDE